MKPSRFLSLTAMAVILPATSFAQVQPDAGQTLQEIKQQPTLEREDSRLDIQVPTVEAAVPGGPQVRITAIELNGNSALKDEELMAVIGDAPGKSYDLAGMKNIANRITSYYHMRGYPFARAFVPAQTMAGGTLRLEIVEGRYGAVQVTGDDPNASAAQGFLSSLRTGDVITGPRLERASLILDDQPGYRVTPIIRPGQEVGTGDLDVRLERDKRFGGEISASNHGNRYTGRAQARADLYANSPFMFGDQVKLSTIYTEEDMWYGALEYNAPLGTSGLRGNVGYTHTYYELGKEFSSLDAHGTAKIVSAGVDYPILRSQKANVMLGATYQHKWLRDEIDLTNADDRKTSDSLPVALNFDFRDSFGGGGITYGAFSWTHGILNLDNGLEIIDAASAKSDGHFDKINLDVARLQALPVPNLSFFARASAQAAADNLDSSEDFGLGGPNGVRAYPTGESYGDEGWLTQMEVRYQIEDFTPYAFYDYGQSRTNQDPWAAGDNSRSLGGGGIGVRYEYQGFNADLSAAWRNVGGEPQSDSKDATPLVWGRVGYKF